MYFYSKFNIVRNISFPGEIINQHELNFFQDDKRPLTNEDKTTDTALYRRIVDLSNLNYLGPVPIIRNLI